MLRGLVIAVLISFAGSAHAATLSDGTPAEAVRFRNMPGWGADDMRPALEAFRRSCAKKVPSRLQSACKAAAKVGNRESHARGFFEDHFKPYKISPKSGSGFVTGYYEPEVKGALRPSAVYKTPLLSRPANLVNINPDKPPAKSLKGLRAAMKTSEGLKPYYTRAEIEADPGITGASPLVWLADPVDAFFIHIQGSARIALAEGGVMRVGFAGRNGHPYKAVGRVLIDRDIIAKEDMTAERLKDWLRANPRDGAAIMQQNASYIFFREVTDVPLDLGPIGGQGIPLTPIRSLAVDKRIHAYGMPIFVAGDLPVGRGGALARFEHLMIAQDTGAAIIGPARGDIFFGSGDAAGQLASALRHNVDMYVLLPKGPGQ